MTVIFRIIDPLDSTRSKRLCEVILVMHVQVCLWRYQQATDQSTARGAAGAAAGDAVEEIMSEGRSACNSFALSWLPLGQPTSTKLHVVSAYENGSVLHQTASC